MADRPPDAAPALRQVTAERAATAGGSPPAGSGAGPGAGLGAGRLGGQVGGRLAGRLGGRLGSPRPATRAWSVVLAVAAGLAVAWLAAPPMGTDLSAQVARADFFAAYGWAPIDFRWYAGVSPHGYSLVSPPLMAWFGPRPVGAAAAVISSLALVALLLRTRAPRPLLGGVLGAACFAGNLVSGRVTFALGVALGLLALLAVAAALSPAPTRTPAPAPAPRPASAPAPRPAPAPAPKRAPLLSPAREQGRPAQVRARRGAPAWGAFLSRVPLFMLGREQGRPAQIRARRGAPAWGAFLSRVPLFTLGREQGDPPRAAGPVRWAAVLLLAALAAAASPVAGLFVGLAGAALVLYGWVRRPAAGVGQPGGQDLPNYTERGRSGPLDRPRSVNEGGSWPPPARVAAGGVLLMFGAAVPMAVMAGVFGSGGPMNMSRSDMVHAAVASLAVAALVPHRVVRIGALLSAAGVVASYLLPTPVGLNATRLATMFTLPLVAAYAVIPGWVRVPGWLRRWWDARGRRWPAVWLGPVLLGLVLLGLVLWQPPVIYGDLARAGDPTTSPDHFAGLREELARRQLAGRVEVVPTTSYWEVAHLERTPLARGWLRQADIDRHPLFFDGTLDAASYRRWLTDNGVSYVVLPRTPVSWVGRPEAELIEQGLPYLEPVWEDGGWVLYRVADAPALLTGPAVLRRSAPDAVVFEVTAPHAEVRLRVRWSPLLAVTGDRTGAGRACLARAGEWTTVRVAQPGVYEVTGALFPPGPRC